MTFSLLVGAWLSFSSAGALGQAPTGDAPSFIVGGSTASECQFPTVVGVLLENGGICSGTLIHPSVVLTAAHCIEPGSGVATVVFGENLADGTAGELPVFDCVEHPDHESSAAHDVAFCVLDASVDTLPVVPLIAGCEHEVLKPGQEVVIVGYGATFAFDEDSAIGVGPKRFTTQTIHSFDPELGEINLQGPDGSQSACFGDSGGPAFVRLADGTWRQLGVASHLFDPGDLPPPAMPGNLCGTGVAYAETTPVLDWLERETGLDLTPCHDASQGFTGGSSCGSFPTEIHRSVSTWNVVCSSSELAGGTEVCSAFDGPFDPEGDDVGESTESTGGFDSSTGEVSTESSGAPDPSTTTTGSAPPPPPPPPADDTSTGTEGSSGHVGFDDAFGLTARGCVCRAEAASPRPGLALLGFVGLLGLVGRRRGPHGASRRVHG